LNRVWGGTATSDERAALEFFLLDLLKREGSDGVGDLLRGFPEGRLGTVTMSGSGADVRFTISRDEGPPLFIDTFLDSDLAFLNVVVEPPAPSPTQDDPKHAAFYSAWERLLRTEPPAPDHSDEGERAVFLIGLLEAELMNGGFGQYLANTGGAHVKETLACLDRDEPAGRLIRLAITKAHGRDRSPLRPTEHQASRWWRVVCLASLVHGGACTTTDASPDSQPPFAPSAVIDLGRRLIVALRVRTLGTSRRWLPGITREH
jgi:hypothetical protein